eukprot:349946-Chlamydomonas_euryale.AAC.2
MAEPLPTSHDLQTQELETLWAPAALSADASSLCLGLAGSWLGSAPSLMTARVRDAALEAARIREGINCWSSDSLEA